MQGMHSVKLPLDMHEWESLKVALEKMKESKEKCHNQQAQGERDAIYAQMVQNLEKTRAVVRNS